jgi:hypothetical protein
MLGALLFGKQTFNRQQLHAWIFFLVRLHKINLRFLPLVAMREMLPSKPD